MEKESISIVFRIEKDLKLAFDRIAKSKDLTVSQMLRGYIRDMIEYDAKKNAQNDLFRPPEASKTSGQAKPSPKAKKPPLASREGLLGMFKKKG